MSCSTPEHLKAHLATILEWKNLIIHNVYGAEPYKLEDMLAWCEEFGGKLRPFLCDVPKYLYEAERAGKNIMFEAQLGALRDIDFGIFPIRPPLRPSRAMPASAPVCRAAMWTVPSAS